MDELETGGQGEVAVTDSQVGDGAVADDQGVAEPVVVDDSGDGLEAGAEGVDGLEPTEPEADPWEGVSWQHRQAAERQHRDAGWAKAVGPDVLEGLVETQNDLGRQFAALGRLNGPAGQRETPEGVPAPVETAKPTVPVKPGDFAFDLKALEEGMEVPDAFANTVLNPLQERIRKYDQSIAKLEGFYQQAQQREQEQHFSRALEALDTFVAAPEMAELHDVYGAGPTNALDMNGAPVKARAELVTFALQLQEGLRMQGRKVELSAAMSWAAQITNSGKIAAAERDRGRKEADALKRTATRRPATRNAAPEEKTEKEQRSGAIEYLRGMMKRKKK